MYVHFPQRKLCLTILMIMSANSASLYAADVQFNTDLLDISDKNKIELGLFSKPGYIMPGDYLFKVNLNNQYLVDKKIIFATLKNDKNTTEACLSKDLVDKFGLTKQAQKKLVWHPETDCLILESLEGTTVQGNLPKAVVNINIPQAYLQYRSENWDPAALWNEGINGAVLDYNIAANSILNRHNTENDSTYIGANGVAGLNFGAWRFRADWQSNYQHINNQTQSDQLDFNWNRFYVYRALPAIRSQLVLGENYLNSDLFDSFRFTGASLSSDTRMLPPNLRGYAPQVTGIAQSNARVVISQLGQIVYQTQVPAGPFKIQDLNDAVSGTLNVRIEEEDGSVRLFDVETASIPFLTRPGSIRYRAAIGRPSTYDHKFHSDLFLSGEFSWGVSNGWSLFSGSLNSKDYNALSLGIGRDLLALGAISFDITQSFANLDQQKNIEGRSYRVNYSKRFEEINSQIQFAGYRFSEKDFLSMSDFLALRGEVINRYGQSKEMYNISLNQNLPFWNTSINLSLNHQTYWDYKDRDYYSLSVNKVLDIGPIKNANLSLSAYQNNSETKDTGAYLSLSLPLNSGARLNYSLSHNDYTSSHQLSYFNRLNNATNYQFNTSFSDNQNKAVGGFISHTGDRVQLNANINHIQNKYTTIGGSSQGGITLTAKGADFHRSNSMGGTRVMIDTEQVPDIPVTGGGVLTTSNYFGKAVITDVSEYTRNKIQVDVNKLPKNTEVIDSVFQTTLTQGAIGYYKLNVVSGQKKMLTLILENGDFIPFGTTIMNSHGRTVGMVDENGLAYLSGINLGEKMLAQLGNDKQCSIIFTESNMSKDIDDSIVCELDLNEEVLHEKH